MKTEKLPAVSMTICRQARFEKHPEGEPALDANANANANAAEGDVNKKLLKSRR